MSDTILVKSFMDIYPEWVAGECKVFHGATEVEKVVARDEHGKPSYILWSVEGEWWHAFGNDTLRVEWQQASEAPAPSAHASEAAADVTTSRALDDLAGDFVRFRMMLAETLGLADIELLDESNEEVCERVATLQTALAAAQERERGLRAALRPFSDVYTRYTAHLAEHGKQSLTFIGFIMRYEENDSFGNLFMEALFTLVSVPAQQPAGAGGGE